MAIPGAIRHIVAGLTAEVFAGQKPKVVATVVRVRRLEEERIFHRDGARTASPRAGVQNA